VRAIVLRGVSAEREWEIKNVEKMKLMTLIDDLVSMVKNPYV
jgi:hypothetical protein